MLRNSYQVRHHNSQHSHAEQPLHSKPFFGSKTDAGVQRKERSTFFQAKLSVGEVGDKYEKEADSVADAVVNSKSTTAIVQQKKITGIQRQPAIQTKCASCEEEEKKTIQRSAATGQAAGSTLSTRITGSSGNGRPMHSKLLSEMSNSFGVDFRHVNIHTGNDSVQMNQELGAQAFTHGSDIYFNSGKYNPESSSGKHLLAHELTHVVQQTGSDQVQRSIVPDVQANCAGKPKSNCHGDCTHSSGHEGLCRWSGTLANGCVCYEKPRKTLEEVLPYWILAFLSAAAIAVLAACFATGVCEAAIIIGAAGAAVGAIIIGLFKAAGIEVTGEDEET